MAAQLKYYSRLAGSPFKANSTQGYLYKKGVETNGNREQREKGMAQQEPGNKTIPPKLLLSSSPPEETERATPAVRGVKDQTDAQMFCSLCDILPELWYFAYTH